MEVLFVDGPLDRTRQQVPDDRGDRIHALGLRDPADALRPGPGRYEEHTYRRFGPPTEGGTAIFVWDNPHRLRMNGVPE